MKRTAISLLLALALVLCAVLVIAPQAQAATQPCSGDHTGWTELPTAGGELAAGTYYVAADATLDATIAIAADAEVTICLNGKTLTAPEYECAISVATASTLKICDCSGTHAGTLKGNGDVDSNGGVVSITAAGATVELYSGTITGGRAKTGGNVYVNKATFKMYDGRITNGTAFATTGRGGNLYLNQSATAEVLGGIISGGKATQRGGNISVQGASGKASNLKLDNCQVIDPVYNETYPAPGIMFGDNGYLYNPATQAYEKSLAGIDDNATVTVNSYVYFGNYGKNIITSARVELRKLYGDIAAGTPMFTGNQDIYLDLNGHAFAGTWQANTATGKVLYVFDSTSDDFSTVAAGTYAGTLDASMTQAANGAALPALNNIRYLEINGTYQRFSLGIDTVSLELDANGNVDLGYSALIKGNSAVKGALSGFGIYVGKAETYETGKQPLSKQAADFVAGEAGNKVTLRVDDVMTAGDNTNKDADVKVQAFIKVGNTEIVGNDAVAYSVQDIVDAAAAATDGATTYPEFYALIEEIKTKYTITVTAAA